MRFTKPGRDTQASRGRGGVHRGEGRRRLRRQVAADGLFGERRPAEDHPPVRRRSRCTEVSAGHTIYLEELGLKPGDFVSYFAKATDNDEVQGPKTASSDIYFVQIRPFKKDYKPAQSQAHGRRRRRRRAAGRRALAPAARNRRGDLQHRPRQGEDQARQVPRERRLPEPRAGEAARAGRGAGRQAEGAARRGRSRRSTRSPKRCRRRPRK